MKKIFLILAAILILGIAAAVPAFADSVFYSQDFSDFSAGDLSSQLSLDALLSKTNGYSRITSGKLLQTKLEAADSGIGVNLPDNSETEMVARLDIYPYANMDFAITLSDLSTSDRIVLDIPSAAVVANEVTVSDDTALELGECAVVEIYADFSGGMAYLYVNSILEASNIPINISKLSCITFAWSPTDGYDVSNPLNPIMDNIIITSDNAYFPVMQKAYDFQTAVMPEDGYFDYEGVCYMYGGRFYTIANAESGGGALIDISNFMRSDEAFFEIEAVFDTDAALSFELDSALYLTFDSSDMKVYDSSGAYAADFSFGTSKGNVTFDFYVSDGVCDVYADGMFLISGKLQNENFQKVGFVWSTESDEELRCAAESITVCTDSRLIPEKPGIFTYENDFSESISDEYLTCTNVHRTSGGIMQFASSANWGCALVTNMPGLGSKVYVSFDLWHYSDAIFKIVVYNDGETVSNTNNSNYILMDSTATSLLTSSGQSYDYDFVSALNVQTKVELEFDLTNSRIALYMTKHGKERELIAGDIDIGVSSISALKLLVENRTGSKPLADNLLITNDKRRFPSDFTISPVSIDDTDDEFIKANVNIVNWNTDADYYPVVVLASYDDNRLCDVSIAMAEAPDFSVTCTQACIKRETAHNRTVKAFLLDSMTSLTPVGGCEVIQID